MHACTPHRVSHTEHCWADHVAGDSAQEEAAAASRSQACPAALHALLFTILIPRTWTLSAQVNSSAADEEVEEALQFQLEELTQVAFGLVASASLFSNERGEPWAALLRLRGGRHGVTAPVIHVALAARPCPLHKLSALLSDAIRFLLYAKSFDFL